jgi:hypothetical protein
MFFSLHLSSFIEYTKQNLQTSSYIYSKLIEKNISIRDIKVLENNKTQKNASVQFLSPQLCFYEIDEIFYTYAIISIDKRSVMLLQSSGMPLYLSY